MRLDCSRNPPVSPSASHPPLARGAMELAGVQRGIAYGKELAFPFRPARQLGVREAGDAFRSQAASVALPGKAASTLPTRPDNSGFGLQRKRSTAKGLPARDGSERRQIPLPFFGAGKGSSGLPE